jgi:hypothetical protein
MNSENSTLRLNQVKPQKEPQNNDVRKIVGATRAHVGVQVEPQKEVHPTSPHDERDCISVLDFTATGS